MTHFICAHAQHYVATTRPPDRFLSLGSCPFPLAGHPGHFPVRIMRVCTNLPPLWKRKKYSVLLKRSYLHFFFHNTKSWQEMNISNGSLYIYLIYYVYCVHVCCVCVSTAFLHILECVPDLLSHFCNFCRKRMANPFNSYGCYDLLLPIHSDRVVFPVLWKGNSSECIILIFKYCLLYEPFEETCRV